MIELELQSMSYGWSGATIPDNIVYVLRTGDGTHHELMGSIQQLAILYDSIANRAERDFFMGTGTRVEVQHLDEIVEVEIDGFTLTEEESRIRDQLDNLLIDVFEAADRNDPSARPGTLTEINEHLRRYYDGFDFKSLYARLSEDINIEEEP